MSCYMCEPATFDVLADYAARHRVTLYLRAGTITAAESLNVFGNDQPCLAMRQNSVGQLLRDQNAASVEHRYLDPSGMGTDAPYRFRPCTIELDPRFVLSVARCYSYQSCETPDWEHSLAYAIVQHIEAAAVRQLTEGQPWGAREEDVRPALKLPARSLAGAV